MKYIRQTLGCAVASMGLSLLAGLQADDWPQWRGPQRNGTSAETGLLKEWPKEGPRLLWKLSEVGAGYATPAVVGERLYLLANDGMDNEFVAAHAVADGKRIWTARLGKVGKPDQQPKFPAARSTPTVVGDLLYALSSDGDLACLETAGGKVRWQKNLPADFGGKSGQWAYAESPLLDGDTVICSPGGVDATVVALNRKTGEVIWKAALPEGDEASYASPILVEAAGVRQYVVLLSKGLVGLEAQSGRFLWRYSQAVSRFRANIPTPLAADGRIYVGVAGTGGGAVQLKAVGGGVAAEQLYFESKLPTAIGGAVKVGNYLYGTTGQALLCVDFATGQIKWEERALGGGPAALCCVDGRLYLHGENGEVGLVQPTPEGYRETGRFSPPDQPKRSQGMEKAWTYPVVAGGRLYLRDHHMLWCYLVQ